MQHATPLLKEDHSSQIPALQVLQNLGWEYLTPAEALAARGGRRSQTLLASILEKWLRENNRFAFKGGEHAFTDGGIAEAIGTIRDIVFDGLVRTNEKVYDLLLLGKSVQQSVEGDLKSFTVQYIDWEHPERNVFHVTEEFEVERTASRELYIPDIVLFVNGIPLAVIECKRPDLPAGHDAIAQAISQQLRNQKEDGIPRLFLPVQVLGVLAADRAQYGTVGTPARFWAVWKEREGTDRQVATVVNRPLPPEAKTKLFGQRFAYVREHFDALETAGRKVTEQDRLLWSIFRPERLLELSQRFVLFDSAEKKIARYQQYFCVRKILGRIRKLDEGRRQGGVVWHTQGSGKSLTMVMLAKAIALETGIGSHRIVLVTDRVDLDDQIYRTFSHCRMEPEQANTGADLVEKLRDQRDRIITTVIDKFEAAVGRGGVRNEDPNIFVLVDEGHRSQYGERHAKMRKVLPNACYVGFTGTPVKKKDKDTMRQFGGLIDTYTITEAVNDRNVVRLIYEGRHVAQTVDAKQIDQWFDVLTQNLTKEQKADLKKRFTTTDQLNKAEQKVKRIAFDLSMHFRDNYQGKTPFKGQLVAQDKATALLYKKYLDEFAIVSSEVLISGPDEREGEEDVYEENKDKVAVFWKNVVLPRYGTEKEYNRQLIGAFKKTDTPEIIIVVSKLLTGFDAPRNTVLYLTKNLKDHELLQAIARVNRLYDGKEFGFILDYRGVLENLDKALDLYSDLEGFDKQDLADTWTDISAVIADLPQRHAHLWDVFKEVKNKRDMEEFAVLLGDAALRVRFYERFGDFARKLSVALSSVTFLERTPERKIQEYKKDLKFFAQLRAHVRRRYAEVVDFSEYEPKIQKLIDTHVGTGEVEQIVSAIDLFDRAQRQKMLEEPESDAAKADTIAHNTKRVIEEKMDEDPPFYKRFSAMLQEAIEAYRAQRIKAAEYLRRTTSIMGNVVEHKGDDVPAALAGQPDAQPYFRSIRERILQTVGTGRANADALASLALRIDEVVKRCRIVNWTGNLDVQNQMRQAIEDSIFEAGESLGMELSFDEIDALLDECIGIAKRRCP